MRVFGLDQATPTTTNELSSSPFQYEAELESLLHQNPQLLLDESILIIGRQVGVDSGILDLLALDQYGNLLIFELKIGKSGSGSASEETILGQPQSYARSLASAPYDRLNEIYREYRHDVERGRWEVNDATATAESLAVAFENRFGEELEPEEFNPDQRMAIVAEEITSQTQQNSRYLLNQGLNIQCVEIQKFEVEKDRLVLTANTVLDYPLSRVRPEGRTNPTYPDAVADLIDRTIRKLGSDAKLDVSRRAFENADGYRPHIQPDHLGQPAGVKYTLYLRPEEWGCVLVAIDYMGGDDEVLATIRDQADRFEERGFTVSQTRSRDRVVRMKWETDSAEVLADDALLEDVADQFVALIQTGDEVLGGGDIK